MTLPEALAKHAEAMGDDVEPVLMVAHNGAVLIGTIEGDELVVMIYAADGHERHVRRMLDLDAVYDSLDLAADAAMRSDIRGVYP